VRGVGRRRLDENYVNCSAAARRGMQTSPWGEKMARAFSATEPESALRAYLVLIGCAADRRTVTNEELSRKIKRGGPNLIARSLESDRGETSIGGIEQSR
jgi:hypothetical protein